MITRRKLIPAAAGVVALGGLGRLSGVAAEDATPGASPAVLPVGSPVDLTRAGSRGNLRGFSEEERNSLYFRAGSI